MTEFILGTNLCFAVKRWPEPEEWARIVAEELGLKTVQFSFDLMDPRAGAGAVAAYIDHTRIACARHGITIHSTFTGFIPFMNNLFLHPEPAFREEAKAWFKAAIDVTARMKVPSTGGYFGALSMKEAGDPVRRQERMDGWR
ncbi:MAG TPA: xylose isomerase, partial [Planctomycetota bacterium]|nr:xylose isomerase [Planctomycetota bacterium]